MLEKHQLSEVERYQKDGVLFPIPVLSKAHARTMAEQYQSLVQENRNMARRAENLHLSYGWAHALTAHPVVLEVVRKILGEDLFVDGSLILCKPPRDAAYITWHQDSLYSGWHLTPSVSIWLALTPSHLDNGCMQVVRGSHRHGLLPHKNSDCTDNMLERGEYIDAPLELANAVDVTLNAGEMSLHHANIVHGSQPNRTDQPRIGFIARYVTHEIRCQRTLMRVSGHRPCPHLQLAQPPQRFARSEVEYSIS